jgi:FKBP-type peptidyl-prolyl cis-trans isomerase
MKKLILIAFSAIALICCNKEEPCGYNPCASKAPDSEIQSVQSYLSSNNITATQHCSGVFYVVNQPGSGSKPKGCEGVTVNYEGRLTNGSVFDKTNPGQPASFDLDQLVTGFKNGVIQIGAGGKVTIYIPPSLGYGSQQSGPIPPNSILIFTVDLLSVD